MRSMNINYLYGCLGAIALLTINTPLVKAENLVKSEKPLTEIAQNSVINIIGVQVESQGENIEIRLQTETGELEIPLITTDNNNLILDIPNAKLNLPENQDYQQTNINPQIQEIKVNNLDNNQVRVTITGVNNPPVTEIGMDGVGLKLTVMPNLAMSDTEIVITATRREEALNRVPRSITIIPREEIKQQAELTNNLADILGKTVPGFSSPSNRSNTFGTTLRGREISVIIDGIPQNTNLGSIPAALNTIDVNEIERIEVIRGPNAIYGGQATGGLVNIITRRPTEEKLSTTVEVGTNGSFTSDRFLEGSSLGSNVLLSVSGSEEKGDFLGSFAWRSNGVAFDAEGDRIPSDLTDAEDSQLNLLFKGGLNFTDEQRLQFTFNYFQQIGQDTFTTNPRLDINPRDRKKARAIPISNNVQVIGAPEESELKTTNITLQYSHQNILNSELQSQIFYRNYDFVGGLPFDGRGGRFDNILQSPGNSEQWGGRFQMNTFFNEQKTASVLWGLDYTSESSSQTFNVFDPDIFDNSGGLIYEKTGELTFVPPYDFNDLGIFAQFQWEATDKLGLNAGLRYVNLDVDVDDYTTFNGIPIKGGNLNSDEVVFNAGVTYNFTEEFGVFLSFSQGFSLPDLGRVFRFAGEGFAVESGIDLTQPQKVDNYEIGFRGNWQNVQASIAGFFNYSDLGLGFEPTPNDILRTIRAPQRVYGIEAQIDWQPSQKWALGGSLSWIEGENDEDEDGDYLALDSITVPPLKFTAYVENETLPSWKNRLQLLISGDRTRAFDDGVDGVPINAYFTVDYLSSLKLGKGLLYLGVQNLFNEQYLPVYSQFFAPFGLSSAYAGQGRTVSLGYRIKF